MEVARSYHPQLGSSNRNRKKKQRASVASRRIASALYRVHLKLRPQLLPTSCYGCLTPGRRTTGDHLSMQSPAASSDRQCHISMTHTEDVQQVAVVDWTHAYRQTGRDREKLFLRTFNAIKDVRERILGVCPYLQTENIMPCLIRRYAELVSQSISDLRLQQIAPQIQKSLCDDLCA